MDHNAFSDFESKMRAAGLSAACVAAFRHNFNALMAGDTGQIPEASIQPVTSLPCYADLDTAASPDASLLARTAMVKLNGGLGTSMGLESPKSLLPVKDGLTFLDLIVKQVLHLREAPLARPSASAETPLEENLSPSDGEQDGVRFHPNGISRFAPLNPPPTPPRRGAGSDATDFGFPSWEGSGVGGFLGRKTPGGVRFLLMNSLSTSEATLAALAKHPALGEPKSLELLQNFVPKVDQATLRPIRWAENPQLEWCPPGHGDLFPALAGSGWLDRLLADGVKYLFVSNSDNLGASLDLGLLTCFATSNQPFLMEVCERTSADRKGGHLAQRNGRLLLRESAQCPAADEPSFQDINRHRYFNTNNLWVRLDVLAEVLQQHGGIIPLPLIKNVKTVDPRRSDSPKVIQLETAMGAAIECFANAGAIVVPRSRFAPVKTCSDLLAVRSDAYEVTPDWRIELRAERQGQPPALDLDGKHYKLVDQLDALTPDGPPSLRECTNLTVRGPVRFHPGNTFRGKVSVTNMDAETKTLAAGTYADGEFRL